MRLAAIALLLCVGLLTACAGTPHADSRQVLHLDIDWGYPDPASPARLTIDGVAASLANLENRLAELQKQGGAVSLDWSGTASASPGVYVSEAQRDEVMKLKQRVTDMVRVHDLPIVRYSMPLVGSASPDAPRQDR